jgi:glycosyltransferase involved in cell wall biosynthesis
MLFSVAIIAKNAAKTLPNLLADLNLFICAGGNVIVCDTGSTDNTVSIAKSHGCVVVEKTFDYTITSTQANAINHRYVHPEDLPIVEPGCKYFNFSEARNYCAGFTETDYALVIDCDVRLKNFDFGKINEIISQTQADTYTAKFVFAPTMAFECIFMYNRKKCSYSGSVHEIVTGWETQEHLPADIFWPHHEKDEKSRKHYLYGLAADAIADPENPRAMHYLAREMHYTGRYKSAIKLFLTHAESNGYAPERSESCIIAGQAAEILGDDPTVCYHQAFTIDCTRRAPFIALARYYFNKKQWQQVMCYASAALAIPKTSNYIDMADHYTHVPYGLRYVGRYNSGLDMEGAREDFEKAYLIAPEMYEGDRHFFA